MAYTAVTITDTIKDPSAAVVPYAIIVAWPRAAFINAGTQTNAVGIAANSSGVFSLVLNATNDAGTANVDPALDATASYHILAFDPRSGEHIFDADVSVPSSPTTTTLAALPVL